MNIYHGRGPQNKNKMEGFDIFGVCGASHLRCRMAIQPSFSRTESKAKEILEKLKPCVDVSSFRVISLSS